MSENMKKETPSEHGFIVRERAHVEIRGMTEVLCFDETSVALATTRGEMLIEGRDLRVGVLDVKEGTVSVYGHIESIYYRDEDTKDASHGLFGRLFHG